MTKSTGWAKSGKGKKFKDKKKKDRKREYDKTFDEKASVAPKLADMLKVRGILDVAGIGCENRIMGTGERELKMLLDDKEVRRS